ncbi:MAG TPA: histidine kinase [Ilumatobacter sp.]|nr:histidine kinase [Ilumatobacter sp.]
MTTGTPVAAGERETALVSDLPPPPPPPPGSGGPHGAATGPSVTPPPSEPHFDLHGEWSWERVGNLAKQWYSPLAEPNVWLNAAYLTASMVLAWVFLIALLVFGSVAFGLLFIFVGVFLVGAFFATASAFADVSVALNRMCGRDIDRRPVRPLRGVGPRSALRAVSDRERWRVVGFLAANTLVAQLAFAIGILPLSVAMQFFFGGGPVNWLLGGPLVGVPLAALLIGLFPRVVVPVGDMKGRFDAWFLGTDRLAAAEQRVSALTGQRDDILDAVAAERRRIERNLHDGVQQQLVAIGLDLGMAETHVDTSPERARELIVSAREKVQGSIGELRQLGRGLHPAILEDRGIDAALSAVVAGAPIPVSVHVDADLRLSRDVEEAVYFLANEAIANILKHSQATVASVHVMRVGRNVRVIVHDNGVGGASVGGGTGVGGMRARVRAVDGTFTVTSPKGGPTTLDAEIPLS